MMNFMLFTILSLVSTCALAHRVNVEMVPMRDGVKLHTVIVFPRDYQDGDKKTVIMDRSPYGSTGLELLNDLFLPSGFITVGQDMRGTGKSQGNFSIWHTDANDSQDLGDWLVQQSWSNGVIYTFGASADGLGAFRTPDNQPEWLKAQYFIWSSSDLYSILFPNGAYLSALADMWIRSTVPDEADADLVIIAQNEMETEWWNPLSLKGEYWKIKYPSAFWVGWYDIFLVGNLGAFDGYNSQSDESVRYTSKILIDPLGHCQAADEYFPQDLVMGRTLLGLLQALELYGVRPVRRPSIHNVTFYVMSSNDEAGLSAGNYWTSMEKFPTPKMTNYYLQADGTASKTISSEDSTSASSYKHDPSNPIPSQGGNNLAIACGPLDQGEVDKRADVLVFETAPFEEEEVYTGPIFATLYVSSDAIDTDFMVRMSDKYPTGEVRLLQDNAIRMRWREGGLTPIYMDKGVIYKAEFSLWNTSYVMAPGHSLRFSVSSSNSPRFDVNRNNGILLANRTDNDVNITATNVLYHSKRYPSHVSLPVVKKVQLPKVHDIKAEVTNAYPHLDIDKIVKEYPQQIANMAFPFSQATSPMKSVKKSS